MNGKSKPKFRRPARAAAGVKAALIAFGHLFGKAGVLRGSRAAARLNQTTGFDCPGCAWADPLDHRKAFEFCENGAKAVADEAMTARVDAGFFAEHSISDLKRKSARWLNAQGRICKPVYKPIGKDHYQAISWEDANGIIAGHLQRLAHPDRAAFYTSGRTSNEAAFVYQLFVRRLGTNNFPDCSNMCHESSGVGLTEAVGVGKGSVSLDDFQHTDLILVFGQNPGSNHPRMLATLEEAKLRGARIIAINPLTETGLKRFRNPQKISGLVGRGTVLADHTVNLRINGDVPLILGIIKAFVAEYEAHLDREFIDRYTTGFEDLAAAIEKKPWSSLEAESGISRAEMETLAGKLARSRATIACWAMGITQHVNAIDNIQSIINLLLLQGNVGRPGAGFCPVRGHSNVQGDRTMGIWEHPDDPFLDALGARFQFNPPRQPGYNTVDTLYAMLDGAIDVFFAMGGNFSAATPDTVMAAEALAKCALTVQVSTKLNLSHLHTGKEALILPALGHTDEHVVNGKPQFTTSENSMGIVQPSRGALPALSDEMRSEVAIITSLAESVFGGDDSVEWRDFAADYDHIRDAIASVLPDFKDMNARLLRDGHIQLPHPVRDERRFTTASGKAHFMVPQMKPVVAEQGRFVLTTLRTHDQFNTTVYTNNDRYRGIRGSRRVLFMDPEDMRHSELQARDRVRISSHYDDGVSRSLEGFAVVPYKIPRGCVAAYYPETNPLIALGSHSGSKTPAYKSVIVSIEKL